MNLTHWILIVTIALCMALTEQAGTETSYDLQIVPGEDEFGEYSIAPTPDRVTCLRWITIIFPLKNHISVNKLIAEGIAEHHVEDALNIWAAAYRKYLLYYEGSLDQSTFCILFRKDVNIFMGLMTPLTSLYTCPFWLSLGGFTGVFLENIATAESQERYSAHKAFSDCGRKFVTHLTERNQNRGELLDDHPVYFCLTVLGIPLGSRVSFDSCDSQSATGSSNVVN